MTDLDERFRPLIDESASQREPVELIETRAREYRRRDRRRHRAQGFVAGVVAIALIVGAVAVVRSGSDESASPARPASSAPTTTTAVSPAGWTVVDYGLARLSIPPGWTAGGSCPQAYTLSLIALSTDRVGCGAGGGTPTMSITPWSPPRDTAQPFVPNGSVNGIAYELVYPRCLVATCGPFVHVKALGVAIDFVGDVDLRGILRTLTYSTYARVLQQPTGPTPASWKTIEFDGVEARVPRSWRTVDPADVCVHAADTAYVGGGRNYKSDCITLPFQPAADWIQLSTLPSALPQILPTTSTTIDPRPRQLRLTRQASNGPLTQEIEYFAAGSSGTVVISIGLGLDPAIARSILGSLRAIGP